jgi:hypothetical protein
MNAKRTEQIEGIIETLRGHLGSAPVKLRD